MNEAAKDALTGIGAMCEIAGFMLTQLQKNGFTREEAYSIAAEYVFAMLNIKPQEPYEEELNEEEPE